MLRQGSLLRNRDLRLVAGAIGLSALGDWLALVALVIQVEEMTDSGIAVSALFICLWAPVVVLAGHAGQLVDQFETTRLLAVVSVAQAGVAAVLAFTDSLAPMLALTALLGVGFAVSQAAEFALVPAVAERERLREANGYVETARYVGFTIGPVCGGLLAASGGTTVAMLVNAVTFVAVAVAAVALNVRRHPQRVDGGEEELRRARDGVVHLFRDAQLAVAMTVAFVSLLFMSASIPADVIFIDDVLGIDDLGFGTVYSLWTIGMVLGALVISKRVPITALAAAAFVGVAAQGLGKALPPLWLVFPFMLACYFGAGVGHGVKNVMFRTLIHQRVPDALHGRAFAAYNGLRNGAELGALAAGGVLVALLGARATLLIAGGVSALTGLAGLAFLRARRAAREDVGEAALTR